MIVDDGDLMTRTDRRIVSDISNKPRSRPARAGSASALYETYLFKESLNYPIYGKYFFAQYWGNIKLTKE